MFDSQEETLFALPGPMVMEHSFCGIEQRRPELRYRPEFQLHAEEGLVQWRCRKKGTQLCSN